MLFTIVKEGHRARSFRGLLFVGRELPEDMRETSQAMPFIDRITAETGPRLLDEVCFVHSIDEDAVDELKGIGFKLYRCREL